jgi:hypothetical protein
MSSSPPKAQTLLLSYAYRDGREAAEALYFDLHAEGYQVWLDIDDLMEHSHAAIQNPILQADFILALITPTVIHDGKSFVQSEIRYALSLKKTLIPLRFCPDPLPPALRGLPTLNFQNYARGLASLRRSLAAYRQAGPQAAWEAAREAWRVSVADYHLPGLGSLQKLYAESEALI